MAQKRRPRKRFLVSFGELPIGFSEAADVRECLRILQLESCIGRSSDPRRYCPGSALHGHVPAGKINQYRTVDFPGLGTFAYSSQNPPAVTFRAAPPVP